ncbi:MAG: zinc ribbon domain-containing protein [Halobacteriaceae archaeon]
MLENKRAYLAAALAVLYPGLGHVYLRSWLRAAAWFALALFTASVVVPTETIRAMGSGDLETIVAASESLPLEVALTLLAVRALNVVDAYLVAAHPHLVGMEAETDEASEGPGRCPSCGKDLDADLDFCPWCTQTLDAAPVEEEESGGAGDGRPTSR